MTDAAQALLSAIAGGGIAFASSFLTARQTQAHERKQQQQKLKSERFGTLFPMRRDALQMAWYMLLQARLGVPFASSDRDLFMKYSIWLPPPVQAACIEAFASITDSDANNSETSTAIDKATGSIVDYVSEHLEAV